MSVTLTVQCSWRYGVVGIYKDREKPIVHAYVPFVRLTIEWPKSLVIDA